MIGFCIPKPLNKLPEHSYIHSSDDRCLSSVMKYIYSKVMHTNCISINSSYEE